MDKYFYPVINVQNFANLCLNIGTGHLKAVLKEEKTPKEKDLRSSTKSFRSSVKSNAGKKKKSTAQPPTTESAPVEDPKPTDLFHQDMLVPVYKTLLGRQGKQMMAGELMCKLS